MKPELTDAVKDAYASIFSVAVKPERLADFLAALDEVLPHSANEEGIIRFEVFRDRSDPLAFTIVDLYRNRDAFDNHGHQPHVARLVEALDGCFEGDGRMGLYELYDGIPSKA